MQLFVCVVIGRFGICGCRSQCSGCMIVALFPCHVRRYMRGCQVMLQNALRGCMGLVFGEEAGARNTVCFRVKWPQPAMPAMKGNSPVMR